MSKHNEIPSHDTLLLVNLIEIEFVSNILKTYFFLNCYCLSQVHTSVGETTKRHTNIKLKKKWRRWPMASQFSIFKEIQVIVKHQHVQRPTCMCHFFRFFSVLAFQRAQLFVNRSPISKDVNRSISSKYTSNDIEKWIFFVGRITQTVTSNENLEWHFLDFRFLNNLSKYQQNRKCEISDL